MHQGLLCDNWFEWLGQTYYRCVCVFHTFFHHAYTETLLEAAVLAAISSSFVHRAVFTGQTHVLRILLHRPLQPPTINREKGERKKNNKLTGLNILFI